MANIDLYKQKLVAIANAIRTKLNTQSTYKLEQMPDAILSIPTGGEGVEIAEGYTNKFSNSVPKDYSFSTIVSFSDITIANGYEILTLIRS